MAILKTDSPLSRRIVLSFLDFLDSVEPAPGVDLEGLEVAKECLAEIFKINSSSLDNRPKPGLLVNIFSSWEASEQDEVKSDLSHEAFSADAPSSSSVQKTIDANHPEASQYMGEDWSREVHTSGISNDELFGQFFGALEKINYFKTTSDGQDDQLLLDRATRLFQNAVAEMQKSGCHTFDQKSLAETLKSQGNKAMQSKLYPEAIELYSCAIALCEDNAVYYCNRAAAYTQINQYTEAIGDCLKAIEIRPNYSKAYSRLGFAYYAQGKYRDAINKGFSKALQLDPDNVSIKENIAAAQLKEEQRRTEHNQSSGSSSHHQESNHHSAAGSRSYTIPPQFTSATFNANSFPADIASMFMNMAGNGPQSQNRPEAGNEPGIRIGGNINVNLGEHMPEELSGTLRSVMEMFSGATGTPHGNPQDNANGRSGPS